jgi:small subunit ribosomal protein S15
MVKQEVSKEEIYKAIEELTNKGKSSAEIGLNIKQELKIKNVHQFTGKKIEEIQTELGLRKNKLPDDLLALIKRAVKLIKHKENNKKDMRAKRGYQLTVSKINRLRNYYIKTGKLPKGWRYSDATAKLLVK